MTSRSALITGISGQDGSYLAELLLRKGYRVTGIVRRSSSQNLGNISTIIDNIDLIDADIMDQSSINNAIRVSQPDEVYNLAAQSFVATSFYQPVLTGEVTGLGTLRVLEAVHAYAPMAKVYQASSSEMFGRSDAEPQDESTPFHPRSPYGAAKVYAYWVSVNYREAYSMFVSNGIFFNHESPRRGLEFVTRKITDGVARIAAGRAQTLTLGNLEARRDWGFAPDYVDLMWRILQAKEPGDYVGATGESHTVREFAQASFAYAGIEDWEARLEVDPRYTRPAEVFNLRGNPAKAKRELDWTPQVRFSELVRIMTEADLRHYT